MDSTLILVVGGTGLLGRTLVPTLKECDFEVLIASRQHTDARLACDFSSREDVYRVLNFVKPDIIINLAGLTDVESCEQNPNLAYRLNVKIVENIVDWMQDAKPDCHLVHVSTDHVYDGPGLHSENEVSITNYYAFSKYAGELAAKNMQATILRTNFFGKSLHLTRKSLSDWLYQSLIEEKQIQIFSNVMFSPLSMDSLSSLIIAVCKKRVSGVFNVGSHNGLSKADFAFYFAKCLKKDTQNMQSTTTDKVDFLKTYRPEGMLMNIAAFEKTFDVVLPDLKSEIALVVERYYE